MLLGLLSGDEQRIHVAVHGHGGGGGGGGGGVGCVGVVVGAIVAVAEAMNGGGCGGFR